MTTCDDALGRAVCGTFDKWYDTLLPVQQDALLKHLEDTYELIHLSKIHEVADESRSPIRL